jgi:FkbM family methyltransferase
MGWDLFWIRLRKLAVIATHGFYRVNFLRHGVAPAIEHDAVLRGLKFDFVVDVGANRGQFSLVCRRLNPQAAIVAFEPQEGPARTYRAVFEKDARTRLHVSALAPQRGGMKMNISASDDSSSLLPISKLQTENFPGTGAVEVRSVSAGPLSDFVNPAELGMSNLLKIDVQGFELEVLKSAEPLLSLFDKVYAECSFAALYEGQALADEIIAWLEERGFRLSGQFNPAYTRSGTLLQADLLFENRKRC